MKDTQSELDWITVTIRYDTIRYGKLNVFASCQSQETTTTTTK
jgi:hypothetical protein